MRSSFSNFPQKCVHLLGFGVKCLPPPTKRVATVVLYDTSWTSADTRPEWTFMNHTTTAPNVRPVLPSGRSCVIRFVVGGSESPPFF